MAPGKRRKNYSEEDMLEAVEALRGGMSSRNVEAQFGIPRKTVMDRAAGLHGDTIGQPPVLSMQEEEMICSMVVLLSDWGFPFNGDDLRYFVKAYLDKKGVTENWFKDNLPTHRWLDRFLGRHKTLTLRKTNAIKRSRAMVSREDVQEFFKNFIESAMGVAPENMVNYNETNFRDDVSLKKCITKKGRKYVEKVINTSKQANGKNCHINERIVFTTSAYH